MKRHEPRTARYDAAGRSDGWRGRCTNRSGTSLVELVVAVVILGVGIAGVASLTAAAAGTLVRARSIDEAHALLQSFVDSAVADPVRGPESGRHVHPAGALNWSVPHAPGSVAWARFDHVALTAPIRVDFVVPASPTRP
ncbi:MAG: prepilin-type N-terminal cleavage/methylation domain-containing protein [Gemmatimonadota bacterium]|nr:prepilin-type N-terminal cleavage/methylation domain-containing protein [Gemmatimonadota bacterium]MDE2870498.1 prepilin-type N-terminal cleavage/methylation domain-containing protein [Gemmatimonadota bacterium]